MGSCFDFTCDKCSYSAEVSGGKDRGMMAVVQTMICNSCHEVVDVLIGQCGEEGPSGDPDYDKRLGLCPKCDGKDVIVWEKNKPCPKCDGRMIQGESFILWD